ncbi:Early nodulin-like protein [Thalictrum thalictroides]|uniref:Early nodulin-like protein n=1 Tax=Thalictrum thalictroides TaxID=46969 RepID=A0A7J6USN8_THATH|nr:Early nodulin-like protein [Thalictrum thalictroides]
MATSKANLVFLVIIFIASLKHFTVTSFKYEVGNTNGWVVPASNDSKVYNKWASDNRFKIGDTIYFKYQKDSVMLVTEDEYKQCNTTQPIFFGNNGNTEFSFDRSGSYYFISGVSGHCEKGQKMIVRVLVDDGTTSSGHSGSTSKHGLSAVVFVLQLVVLSIGSLLF